MSPYETPKVTTLGTVQDLTQTTFHKNEASGDVIVINGTSIPVPGNGLTSGS